MGGKLQLSWREWNFSKAEEEGVPDNQLVACYYWEYARESAFIREVVQNLKDVDQRKGSRKPLDAANRDLTRLYSIGIPVVELFRRLPFPKPWQSLTPAQRSAGKDFAPGNPTLEKFPPFRTSNDHTVAGELYSQAQRIHDKEAALWKRLVEIGGGAVNLEEASKTRNTLSEQAKHPNPVVSRGIGGVDSFIAQINWCDFDDNEIVKCFERWVKDKGNRPVPVTQQPKGVRGLRGGPGRDPYEWRASLERLGLLRLRRRYTFAEAKPFLEKLPQTAKTKTAGECNREAKKAVDDFHTLFPFLDSAEMPLSMK